MEGSRAVDAYGCAPGNINTQSDAEQAYTQSFLGTVAPKSPSDNLGGNVQVRLETWVSLPPHLVPEEHRKRYVDPVYPLVLALYGHPDAGGHWERHCDSSVLQAGFIKVPKWPSMYWHPKHRCLLTVYVDDFKMSGPPKGCEAC